MKFFLRLVGIFALISLLIVSSGAYFSSKPESRTTATESVSEHKITRFLVMGRDRAAGLTDSIFVVTLNETQKEASILQIPRDTYAEYTDRDYKKLNGALGALGPEKTTALMTEALGVTLDYFVVIDLDGVRKVVDAIDAGGGVIGAAEIAPGPGIVHAKLHSKVCDQAHPVGFFKREGISVKIGIAIRGRGVVGNALIGGNAVTQNGNAFALVHFIALLEI